MTRPVVQRVSVIDSHTGGEPTRVVIDGGPDLGEGGLAERREFLRHNFDSFRSAVVTEPRGSNVLVGGLLQGPVDPSCTAGVIFFNNVGYLGMCGHGAIGVIATLAYLGRIEPGEHRLETPVGVVTTRLHPTGEVTIRNVASYRTRQGVEFEVEGFGKIRGDVAWGGNWFFLSSDHGQEVVPANIPQLEQLAWAIRGELGRRGITGDEGQEIDHIELFGPPMRDDADSKNFVLCPGRAYDRSPCGTGTSAKLACLFADGHLAEGQIWRQEGIVGSVFAGQVEMHDGHVIPHIMGSAFVTGEATLIFDPRDPFRTGLPR